MKVLTAFLLLFNFSFSSLLNAQEEPWQLKQTQAGIPVYTRKVAGSPILEYRSNVIIDAPIVKAIALFEDAKQIRRWYYQCVRSELVTDEDANNKVIYLILHLPWPVAPRDFVFRRTKTEDQANKTVSYSLTALPDKLPLVKGMVRVVAIKSIWTFKSLPNGQTEFSFQQHTDPAGSIPPSLVNKIGVYTPLYSLKNFRKLLTGKDV